jgi:hypothetical protein
MSVNSGEGNMIGRQEPRLEEADTDTEKVRLLEQKAVLGVESINILVDERNHYHAEADRLSRELEHLHIRHEMLQKDLAEALARADHYDRFSTEVVTQFNTIVMLVHDISSRARKAAQNRPGSSPMTKTEQEGLKAIAEMLKPEPLDDDGVIKE